jgi:dihydroflavonol-4-reductase
VEKGKKMRALVTGGTGFVGANLVKRLNEMGIQARILRRESSSLEALEELVYEEAVGDILDVASLVPAMEGCEWVFHVAAVSDYWRKGIDWLYHVNVEGTRKVVEAARIAGVERLVYTSSIAALGVAPDGELIDETHTFNLKPKEFWYGHSKHLAEGVVREAVAEGLDAVIVNPALVIGPRDVNRISGSLVIEVARGLLRFYLPGGFNFAAVEDVAAGHVLAAERGRVGERYILGGENLPLREVIDMIVEVTNGPKPLFSIPRWALEPTAVAVELARKVFGGRVPVNENQVRMVARPLYLDTGKAVRELGLPQTPFRTAVERAYRWYREHGYLA